MRPPFFQMPVLFFHIGLGNFLIIYLIYTFDFFFTTIKSSPCICITNKEVGKPLYTIFETVCVEKNSCASVILDNYHSYLVFIAESLIHSPFSSIPSGDSSFPFTSIGSEKRKKNIPSIGRGYPVFLSLLFNILDFAGISERPRNILLLYKGQGKYQTSVRS